MAAVGIESRAGGSAAAMGSLPPRADSRRRAEQRDARRPGAASAAVAGASTAVSVRREALGAPAAPRWAVISFRREPFRLLFPLGALLALAAVAPWLLFSTGLLRAWPGVYHALTMTQGFLIAIAAGFLGTMIPRRTGTAPLSPLELGLLALSLCSLPLALALGSLALAEAVYLVALITLTLFALRRFRHARTPIPPSFVLIPTALVSGILGALLLGASGLGGPDWTFLVGRSLAEQGVLVPLAMGLAPLLTPSILDNATAKPGRRLWHVTVGGLFLGSFAIDYDWPRLALLVRGLLAATEIVFVADMTRRPRAPGLHRRVYQLAMLMVPTGLLAAALAPGSRVALLHLTFISGLSLLVFAVGTHVTFLHSGRADLAARRPWPVAAVTVFTLLAAATRASAERWSSYYVQALGLAATLWLLATLIWLAYLGPLMLRSRS